MFISLHIELPLPHDRSCIELFPPLAPGRLDVDLRSVAASSLCVPRLPRPPFLLAPARLLALRTKLWLWFRCNVTPIFPPHRPDQERAGGLCVAILPACGDGGGGDDGDGHHHSCLPSISSGFVSVASAVGPVCPSPA